MDIYSYIHLNEDEKFPSILMDSSAFPTPLAKSDSLSHFEQTNDTQWLVNPLVSAASKLLVLATQLREQKQVPPLKELYNSLCQEIKIFENKAYALGYRSQVILAARYLICALIDEIILNSGWGKNSRWQDQSLLATFQRDTPTTDRFFLIIERSAEDATTYMDVLELGYLCLSLGYQGKYRKSPDDLSKLNMFTDNLYGLIRHARGEFSQKLLISSPIEKLKKSKRWYLPPVWLTISIATLAIIGLFSFFYISLENTAKPLFPLIQNLAQLDE